MAKLISISLLLFLNHVVVYAENLSQYCNTNLCKKQRTHIACDNNLKINSSCASYSEMLKLSPKIKQIILNKHNEYRNKLALGGVPHFPSATRMATMRWNDELEFMASLNVKSCTGTHDTCRNTRNFKHSGQNIARRTTFNDTIPLETLEYNIYHGIDRWFREHLICERDRTVIFNNGKKKCGHFTVMIADRNTHLGCAVMHMKKEKTVFTCNYAWTNIKNAKLYNTGRATSQCKTGKNPRYQGLCSINEKYP
ncbi:antigen 5 like allergen Cul n 1-like [Episyrphus balteatus]|uniref:antigen 5 like allergen Cul n 1-like n=1 Tax=Episyrphus balteatus TaxID=286459 RepID=UPI0024867789|nr:antigen 5 like allergen Cul n 1-like [Episyrphus balteatus]